VKLGWATCEAAAAGGHLDELQWARARGCEWESETCRGAAAWAHWHLDKVSRWAREHDCPWDTATCSGPPQAPGAGGRVVSAGALVEASVRAFAVLGGFVEMLRWLDGRRAP